MESILDPTILNALFKLRQDLPKAAQLVALPPEPPFLDWENSLDRKLLPRIQPNFPLTAAICGGGSSGKSTLFNTLAVKAVSPTGGTAGINRRVLMAMHPSHLDRENFIEALYEPFDCRPSELMETAQLTQRGDPLYVFCEQIPKNLVLLDTPDFDTGAKGVYANRQLAQNSLEAADILIYIFTNANYNNRDNTDFLAHIIAGIGRRKCFLIYRVYPSFSDEEVLAHAATVGQNIYGDSAHASILGVFRADDENAVAAGEKWMTITPVGQTRHSLMEALAKIDPRKQRLELFASILADALNGAREILAQLDDTTRALSLYLDAAQTAQSHSVREALSHFPMDAVIKRFAKIWLETDPPHIKAMRKTGKIVEIPLATLISVVRWLKRSPEEQQAKDTSRKFSSQLEVDLLGAANQLYKSLVDSELKVTLAKQDPVAKRMQTTIDHLQQNTTSGFSWGKYKELFNQTDLNETHLFRFTITAHPAVAAAQTALKEGNWRKALNRIINQKEDIISLSEPMEAELRALADQFRSRMSFTARVQQTFTAFLNVLPATAAVTYILATGDPVGGVGIKVKLAGLFGLKDLYALVAIPVTAGIKQADLNQLEAMLGPITQTWLNSKLKTVQTLFENEISATLIDEATRRLKETQILIQKIGDHINACAKNLEG
jgi:hypothetical protein